MADTQARIVLSASDKTRAAFASAKANVQGLATAASSTVKSLGALAIAGVAVDQALRIKSAVDELDRLDDLSEKYGIAVAALSGYSYAAQVAGTDTEAFVTGLSKLSKNAAAAAGGDKALAQVFKTLGVSVTDTTGKLRNADVLLGELADKFASYEDGAGKAALAQEVFGKTGAEMIPLLNKGATGIAVLRAEAQQLGLVYGNEVAKAAGDLNDNLKKIELATKAVYALWAAEMIPRAVELTNAFIQAKKEGTLLKDVLVKIFTFSPGQVLWDNAPWKEAETDASKLQVLNAEVERLTGKVAEFQNKVNDPRNRNRRNDEIALNHYVAQLGKAQIEAAKLATIKAKLFSNDGYGDSTRGVKAPAPIVNKQAAGDAEKAAKAYDDLISSINERISANQVELETGKKLTDEQRLKLHVLAELDKGETKYTTAQKLGVTAALDRLVTVGKANDRARESVALLQAESRALAAAAAARDDDNKRLREQVEEIGLTNDQLEQLRIRRTEEAVAKRENRLETIKLFGAEAELVSQEKLLIAAMREGIDITREVAVARKALAEDESRGLAAGVQDYLDTIAKKGDATRDAVSSAANALEDDLVNSFKAGKLDARSFVDTVIAEMVRLKVVRPLLESIFQGFAGFLGGGGGTVPGSVSPGGDYDISLPGRARGGAVSARASYLVGEEGPEILRMGSQGGVIEPNSALGGHTVHVDMSGQVLNVGSGVSRAEMFAALKQRDAMWEARIRRLASQGVIG